MINEVTTIIAPLLLKSVFLSAKQEAEKFDNFENIQKATGDKF